MTTMTAPAPDRRAPRPLSGAPGEPLRFAGLRVGVVGLGVEGIDIVRFLHAEGAAEIVVSERKPIDALRSQIRALDGIPVAIEAGGNHPGLASRVDVLFASQGVPDELPLLAAARAAGVPITAMMRLFLRRCPAPVIGITGSAGKTTVTSLVGAMFEAAGRPAFVGGNIGRGLLSALDGIGPETTAVLEISHTQLARTDRSPRLAAVLNVTPNHLDQFGWDDYVDLKRNLVRHQRPGDIAVLPSDEPVAAGFAADTPATVYRFGVGPFDGPGRDARRLAASSGATATPSTTSARWRRSGCRGRTTATTCWRRSRSGGRGGCRRRRWPTRSATSPACRTGCRPSPRSAACATWTIPSRRRRSAPSRRCGRWTGRSCCCWAVARSGCRCRRWPRRRAAGCGRRSASARRARNSRRRCATPAPRPRPPSTTTWRTRWQAARAIARPGDTVLLSPAGTSFDAYPNFAARGDHFRSLVRGPSPEQWEEGADGAR